MQISIVKLPLLGLVVSLLAICSQTTHASLVDNQGPNGKLNIIDDVGNPSHGLGFLDMSFSVGKTQADALANARDSFSGARLALSSEWDNLFEAAGFLGSGELRASDAFTLGPDKSVGDLECGEGPCDLSAVLGATRDNAAWFWSAPDGQKDVSTTRDYIEVRGPQLNSGVILRQTNWMPEDGCVCFGWLLVDGAGDIPAAASVPEPATLALLGLGLVGLGFVRQRKA